MKTLIVYISYHHGNTEKVAKAIGEVLEAEFRTPESTKMESISGFDLIGFASGNYFGKFDKRLIAFIDGLPRGIDRPAFIFSTHGGDGYQKAHEELRKHLGDKGLRVVGEWHCRAFDTFGPLRLLGGINKGRPNDGDIQDAKRFAEGLRIK
jgi:flavodoxin